MSDAPRDLGATDDLDSLRDAIAIDVLQDIRRCQWPSDAVLGETTCNIGVISGGTRANVIPAAASAKSRRLVRN